MPTVRSLLSFYRMKGGFFSLAIYSNESRFLNKRDLLEKLIKKNVITSDENDLFLLGDMIDYISYSTLGKGLKSTGLVDDNGKFNQNTTANELLLFHNINMDISSLLFKYVLFIEQSLNTTLSNSISSNFGTDTTRDEDLNNPNDYLCKENYVSNDKAIRTLTKIKKHIVNPTKYTSLEYYVQNKNYIPPWVVLNSIYLSDSINLYKIMKRENKTDIVNKLLNIQNEPTDDEYIELKKNLFGSFFNMIKSYRNKLAHPTVLIKHALPNELIFKKIGEYSNYTLIYNRTFDTKYRKSIIFSLILSIIPMINLFDISMNFYFDIRMFLKKYEHEKVFSKDIFDLLNIPKDLESRIVKFIVFKYEGL